MGMIRQSQEYKEVVSNLVALRQGQFYQIMEKQLLWYQNETLLLFGFCCNGSATTKTYFLIYWHDGASHMLSILLRILMMYLGIARFRLVSKCLKSVSKASQKLIPVNFRNSTGQAYIILWSLTFLSMIVQWTYFSSCDQCPKTKL